MANSSLISGWFDFLMTRSFVDRSLITFGTALMVGVICGVILWDVLPGQLGVSQEEHRFGVYAGAAAALTVRTHIHTRTSVASSWSKAPLSAFLA